MIKGNKRHVWIALLAAVSMIGVVGGCAKNEPDQTRVTSSPENVTLTMYNGQHKEVTEALVDTFEAKTGTKIQIRDGSSNELAHQIAEEGDKSPADIIYTEESSPLIMLKQKGMLEKIDADTLNQIPEEYHDVDGEWVGLLARSRVIAYNPKLIKESELPHSLLDLDQAKWKDKFGYVPTSGAFQTQLSAMIKLEGKDTAKAWLEGLKKNGKKFKHNSTALDAVERGSVPFSLINNYYWDREAKERGIDKMNSKLYYFGSHDLGDMITISGAAILKSSPHIEAAQEFLKFAASTEGQQILTDKSAQYPLNQHVDIHGMKPFSELTPPKGTLDLGEYSNGKAAINLLQDVGLL